MLKNFVFQNRGLKILGLKTGLKILEECFFTVQYVLFVSLVVTGITEINNTLVTKLKV